MLRVQVQLTEEQLRALRVQAAREHVSVSELVRRAVDARREAATVPAADELKRRALEAAGRFASGTCDVSQRHDEYLSDAYRS